MWLRVFRPVLSPSPSAAGRPLPLTSATFHSSFFNRYFRLLLSTLTLLRAGAKLTGTFHAAIAFRDQQSPHNPAGTTSTSAAFPHPGHSRPGERSSTSPTSFIS